MIILVLSLLLPISASAAPSILPQDIAQVLTSTYAFPGSVSIGTNTNSTTLTLYGKITSSTTIGSIACSAGTPVLDPKSTDQAGVYAAGTLATNCTYTFKTAWPKSPVCVCGTDAATPIAVSATTTVTSVKCTAAAALTGDNVTYICWGAP